MATISNLLNSGSTIPYDQSEIEAVMKKLLYEQGITDVLYEGSNISQLTSVISYVIGSLNVNTAVNIQETILPLATKRMNVLFGARQLGYEPAALKSFKYNIKLKPAYDDSKTVINNSGLSVRDELNQEKREIALVQNTKFVSNGNTYYYTGPTIEQFFSVSNFEITNNLPAAEAREITIKEGDLKRFDDVDAPGSLSFIVKENVDINGILKAEQEFLLPFHNVEDDGIQVWVRTPDYTQTISGLTARKTIQRTKSKHFLIDETFTEDKDKFIRMENIILQYPVIFFEYGNMGQPVLPGDEIFVNVLISQGSDGEAGDKFTFEDGTAASLFTIEESFKVSQKGQTAETTTKIKENAGVFNNTANRAVTQLDYLAITRRYPKVSEAYAWGGEEEIDLTIALPPQPALPESKVGHVWTSTVPNYTNNFEYRKKVIEDLAALPAIIGELETFENIIGSPLVSTDLEHNWYLSDSEVYGIHNPLDPTNDVDGLIDYLNFYKIITMEIHHRHPLYVDFSYECDIVKYDLTRSKEEINKTVFIGFRDYFADQMEQYNAEYLNSNLQRVLDTILSFQSGIGYSLKVEGTIFRDMIDPVVGGIHCSLSFPFEDMYTAEKNGDKGYLDYSSLPNIDTLVFGQNGGSLTVPYSDFGPGGSQEASLGGSYIVTTDIYYDAAVIGQYSINNLTSTIDIIFFHNAATVTPDEIFGIDPVNEYARFNIEYPYNTLGTNIPFIKNTIPRLKQVSFRDN